MTITNYTWDRNGTATSRIGDLVLTHATDCAVTGRHFVDPGDCDCVLSTLTLEDINGTDVPQLHSSASVKAMVHSHHRGLINMQRLHQGLVDRNRRPERWTLALLVLLAAEGVYITGKATGWW